MEPGLLAAVEKHISMQELINDVRVDDVGPLSVEHIPSSDESDLGMIIDMCRSAPYINLGLETLSKLHLLFHRL
jgi:hypothetical protein